MKKIVLTIVLALASTAGFANGPGNVNRIFVAEDSKDLALLLPKIAVPIPDFLTKVPDVAQYKNADWSRAVGIARGISLPQAFRIAKNNPAITYFFYTKGAQMVLETEEGDFRIFHHGDVVFFSGEPHWGSAPELADGYVVNP